MPVVKDKQGFTKWGKFLFHVLLILHTDLHSNLGSLVDAVTIGRIRVRNEGGLRPAPASSTEELSAQGGGKGGV